MLVAPNGWHTLVTPARTLSLIRYGARPPSRPSTDLLLTTLAVSCGPDTIAVVLSGSGHDAAAGAAAVHRHGGVVLASGEVRSQHYGMPGAAAPWNPDGTLVQPLPYRPLLIQLATTTRVVEPTPTAQPQIS